MTTRRKYEICVFQRDTQAVGFHHEDHPSPMIMFKWFHQLSVSTADSCVPPVWKTSKKSFKSLKKKNQIHKVFFFWIFGKMWGVDLKAWKVLLSARLCFYTMKMRGIIGSWIMKSVQTYKLKVIAWLHYVILYNKCAGASRAFPGWDNLLTQHFHTFKSKYQQSLHGDSLNISHLFLNGSVFIFVNTLISVWVRQTQLSAVEGWVTGWILQSLLDRVW